MPRLAEALVGVAVVHGDEVDIAEDEAVVIVLLQGLRVANVQQLCSVEGLVAILTHTDNHGVKSAALVKEQSVKLVTKNTFKLDLYRRVYNIVDQM